MKSINELINESINGLGGSFETNMSVEVEGQLATAYEASVSYRDILLFTDLGTVTLLVDSYGDRNTFEVFDWDFS